MADGYKFFDNAEILFFILVFLWLFYCGNCGYDYGRYGGCK